MKTAVTILLVVSLLALITGKDAKAQNDSYKNITRNSIETLKEGIKSDNTGVRKSSIYMAGLYKINDVVDVLIDQLQNEKDPNVKVLIALSLYNIGDPEGMKAVKEISEKDQDSNVKRMGTALYRTYVQNLESVSQR